MFISRNLPSNLGELIHLLDSRSVMSEVGPLPLHFCFFFIYMGVNPIKVDKLSAIVPRILSKKEAFISGRFSRLQWQFIFI